MPTGLVVGRLASLIALAAARQAQAFFHAACRRRRQHHRRQCGKSGVDRPQARPKGLSSLYAAIIGGIKERSAKFILEGRFPERIVEKAVERMLPRGPLGRKQLGNLRVYKGPEHPHAAQNPLALDVASLNRKNARTA